MKKSLLAIVFFACSTIILSAQTVAKPLTPEEKAAIKQKQDADLAAAYKEAGISDEQVTKIKDIENSSSTKMKELYASKDSSLFALVGKDAIKKLNEILKKKKETDNQITLSTPPTADERAALKKKQDDDLLAALKETGFTDAQIEKYNTIMTAFKDKVNVINKERNTTIEEIAGKENYKKFKEIQKRQKDEALKTAMPK